MSRAHRKRELKFSRRSDRRIEVPGGRVYSVPSAVSDGDFWESIGIIRVELERNDIEGREWWEAHKFFGGKWQCAGEGASRAEAVRVMRSWRRNGLVK